MPLKIIILLLFITNNLSSNAQVKLCFSLQNNITPSEAQQIFIAGNFNNWNPNHTNFSLAALANSKNQYCLLLPKGIVNFKFTKGSWAQVEVNAQLTDVENRTINLVNDTAIVITIATFKSNTNPIPKATIVGNLKIIKLIDCTNTAQRNISIWTPTNFPQPNKKYSVLYMLDGQNLFNAATAPYGEWGIDEALDSLTNNNIIVVGINHAQQNRIKEYLPYFNKDYPNNYGQAFTYWLVNTVKKTIDKKYKKYIFTNAPHTYIAGSSMGGLLSFYAAANYSNIFGKAGVFSPAFWLAMPNNGNSNCTTNTNTNTPLCFDILNIEKHKPQLFFMAGLKEDARIIAPYNNILNILLKNKATSQIKITYLNDTLGQHNEPTWRKNLPAFINFLNTN